MKSMVVDTPHLVRLAYGLPLYLEEMLLEMVDEYLYLGVIIDTNLDFNKLVHRLFDKSVYKLGLISKTRHRFDQSTSRLLYIGIVIALFDFCCIVLRIGVC